MSAATETPAGLGLDPGPGRPVASALLLWRETSIRIDRTIRDSHREKAWRVPKTMAQRWQKEFLGCAGELFVARQLGIPWAAAGRAYDPTRPDLEPDIEVKAHSSSTAPELYLRPGNRTHWRYILVAGRPGSQQMRGWLWGHEVMVDAFWRGPRPGDLYSPAWRVRPADLHPMSEWRT